MRCLRVACSVVEEGSEGTGPDGGPFVVSCGPTRNLEDQQRYVVTRSIRTVVEACSIAKSDVTRSKAFKTSMKS